MADVEAASFSDEMGMEIGGEVLQLVVDEIEVLRSIEYSSLTEIPAIF